jgi:hypothetical protein
MFLFLYKVIETDFKNSQVWQIGGSRLICAVGNIWRYEGKAVDGGEGKN